MVINLNSKMYNIDLVNQVIKDFENKTNNKFKGLEFVYENRLSEFFIFTNPNQLFFINFIQATAIDNGLPIEADVTTENKGLYTFNSPLLFERINGNEVFESVSTAENILIKKINNPVNISTLRYNGYILTFEKDL